MNASERLRRKVVSRLIDEVDVYYFDKEQLDGKVAKLTYGERSIIIHEGGGGFEIFLNRGGYDWIRYGKMYGDLTNTINECNNIIRNNVMWEELNSKRGRTI